MQHELLVLIGLSFNREKRAKMVTLLYKNMRAISRSRIRKADENPAFGLNMLVAGEVIARSVQRGDALQQMRDGNFSPDSFSAFTGVYIASAALKAILITVNLRNGVESTSYHQAYWPPRVSDRDMIQAIGCTLSGYDYRRQEYVNPEKREDHFLPGLKKAVQRY